MKLTLEMLKEANACSIALTLFEKLYPEGVEFKKILSILKECNYDWYVWLVWRFPAECIEAGADINVNDHYRKSAFEYAVIHCQVKPAKLLITHTKEDLLLKVLQGIIYLPNRKFQKFKKMILRELIKRVSQKENED